jgi:pimeloyl-ACP methyl ester carboxylesterase
MSGVERVDGWFGPPGRPAFGRLHRPAAPRPDAPGVVLCAPIGPEAAGTDRTLRHLAERLAARGLPVLRFDWDGTGDSAGDGLDPDRLGAWARTLREGLAAAGQALGVTRWVLAGVRLGATLAVREAALRGDVDAVVAIAPVVSGRAFVRELKMFGLAGAALRDADPAAGAAAHEAGGWAFDEAAWQAIASIELGGEAAAPAGRVLVLDGGRTAGLDAWITRLREAGAAVKVEPFAGLDAMTADPHLAAVPAAMIDAAVGWIAGTPSVDAARSDRAPRPPRGDWPACARLHGDRGEPLVEHAVRIGGPAPMAGVLTEPAEAGGADPRTPVLLLNAGAAPRSGPSRTTTLLARRLAARGHAVLRVDLPGLGDTPPREGEPEAVVYAPHAVDAVRQAVDWLRERRGGAAPWVGGLCSGGYHGFKAAVAGAPVRGVLAINPLTFFWHGEASERDAHRVIADAVRLQSAAARAGAWRRVAVGEVTLSAIAGIVARRAAAQLEATRRALRRRIGRPLDDDLQVELDAIARRGVAMRFVFATDEPGPALLAFGGGATYRRLLARGAIAVDRIERSDHTFSSRAARERLVACVLASLGADGSGPVPRTVAPAAAGTPRTIAGTPS